MASNQRNTASQLWIPAYLLIGIPEGGANFTFFSEGPPVALSRILFLLRQEKIPLQNRKCYINMMITVNVVSLAINKARQGR